ncbi:MAG: hypothetical protein Kow00127_08700 [Bacteroidales bacterium]
MNEELTILAGTAALLGFVHTAIGPDHYVPFIFIARARQWKLSRTIWFTVLCGLGHVLSSILLGAIGYWIGVHVSRLESIESVRGDLAAWAFVLFGAGYLAWGIYRAVKNKPHTHLHLHSDGTLHRHKHTHQDEHKHSHKAGITPWILFLIFVLGPCEPLIPILMYPAASHSVSGMIIIATLFGTITILTMVSIVVLLSLGLSKVNLGKLERYSHAMAGFVVLISGLAILAGL